jgi:hypothetical protein
MRVLNARPPFLLALLVIVFTGVPASAGFPLPMHDLAGNPADVTLIGAAAGDGGNGVALAAGDFNGDGVDDVLLGQPSAMSLLGAAYVIFGSPSLAGTRDLAAAEFDVVVTGAEAGDLLGASVAAGDVNDDGFDDLLLAAPVADGPANARPNTGEAYVIYGSPSLSGVVDLSVKSPDIALQVSGADTGDGLGTSVASGDFNADGRDDVLLGAPLADGSANASEQAGEAYVIYGADNGRVIDLALGEHDLRVLGAEAGDQLGISVASGDFNADGRDDVLVGAPFADGNANAKDLAGEAYVIYGADNWDVSDLALGDHDLRVLGAEAGDQLGISVAGGDFNADNRADVLIGARFADGNGNARPSTGEAYVIFGDDSWGESDMALGEHHLRVIGADTGDTLGLAVASGDFNDDGRDDVLVGAHQADATGNARSNAGEAYVISGDDNWSVSDMALGEHNLLVMGADDFDLLGYSLAVGDFDGGGRDDLLLSALMADGTANSRLDAGEAYVLFSARCPANINGDSSVTVADIAEVVGSFGNSRAANAVQWSANQDTRRDLNGDWAITAGDIALAVSFFGDICP